MSSLHGTENIGQKHCNVHVNWFFGLKGGAGFWVGVGEGTFCSLGMAEPTNLLSEGRLASYLSRPQPVRIPAASPQDTALCCDASSHLINVSLTRSRLIIVSGCHPLCFPRMLEDKLPLRLNDNLDSLHIESYFYI